MEFRKFADGTGFAPYLPLFRQPNDISLRSRGLSKPWFLRCFVFRLEFPIRPGWSVTPGHLANQFASFCWSLSSWPFWIFDAFMIGHWLLTVVRSHWCGAFFLSGFQVAPSGGSASSPMEWVLRYIFTFVVDQMTCVRDRAGSTHDEFRCILYLSAGCLDTRPFGTNFAWHFWYWFVTMFWIFGCFCEGHLGDMDGIGLFTGVFFNGATFLRPSRLQVAPLGCCADGACFATFSKFSLTKWNQFAMARAQQTMVFDIDFISHDLLCNLAPCPGSPRWNWKITLGEMKSTSKTIVWWARAMANWCHLVGEKSKMWCKNRSIGVRAELPRETTWKLEEGECFAPLKTHNCRQLISNHFSYNSFTKT